VDAVRLVFFLTVYVFFEGLFMMNILLGNDPSSSFARMPIGLFQDNLGFYEMTMIGSN